MRIEIMIFYESLLQVTEGSGMADGKQLAGLKAIPNDIPAVSGVRRIEV